MPSTITDRLNGLTTSVAVKPPCVAVASTNVTLAGLQIVGGVLLVDDDRVLLIGQTDTTENGIYIADSGDWTRAADFDGARDAVQGTLVLVANQFTEGAFYEVTSPNPITFGTSAITFQLRDAPNVIYDLTQGEVSAGVTPTRYNFEPGDVRRYCIAAETNHEQAFIDANAAHPVIYAPAGTWNVDHFVMGIDGRRLRTDGFATILKQRAGNLNRRTIEICASNITIEDIKLEGNIATATGEQQHGIVVTGQNPTKATSSIQNICIGNVWGENLRGDVLEMAAPAGFTTTGISFGVVRGTNIYRNVVSIVGASYITGVGVTTDGGCGYETFDIEPNVGGTASTDISIGWIRGGNLQCAPPSAATAARRIHIGMADLDPAYQPNSTPGYAEGGSSYAIQIRSAVNLRNTIGFHIGYLKIRDHSHFGVNYIYNVGEAFGRDIHIGYFDSSGVGAGEATINALVRFENVETFTLDDGEIVLESPTTDIAFVGASATRNNNWTIHRVRINGTLARFTTASLFSQIIANHTNNIVLLRECDNFVLSNSDITAPRLLANCTAATLISVKATCSTDYLTGTNSNLSLINCSGGLATILAGSATYDPASLGDSVGATTTVTATGAALGDFATATFSLDLQGITLTAWVSAANTVSVRFQNESGGTLDLGSGTLRVRVEKA